MRILGKYREAEEMHEAMLEQDTYAGKVVGKETIEIWMNAGARMVRFPPTYPNVPICEWLCEVGQ